MQKDSSVDEAMHQKAFKNLIWDSQLGEMHLSTLSRERNPEDLLTVGMGGRQHSLEGGEKVIVKNIGRRAKNTKRYGVYPTDNERVKNQLTRQILDTGSKKGDESMDK